MLADSGHRVNALSVTEEKLVLDLQASSFAAVDDLRAVFAADGLDARSEQARSLTGGEGVEARLSIPRQGGDTP